MFQPSRPADLPAGQPTHLDGDYRSPAVLTFSVTPKIKHLQAGTGILNQLCIDYSLRPRLSSRLTLGGRTLPRKPWVYGDTDSNRVYRYLCLHSHFQKLHRPLPGRLQSRWNAFLLRQLLKN